MNDEKFVEIDIFRIFRLLWSRIWIIIITGLLFATCLFSYSYYLIEPQYESSAMFYVNNNNLSIGSVSYSISSSDISASQSLVDTYIVILKTRNTLETVIEKAQLDYSYEQVLGMISASSVNSTEIFKVNVRTGNPKEACIIANTIASVFPDKISSIVTGSGAKIVDYAVVDANKVSPSITKYTLVGFAIGVVIASVLVILRDYLDDTIRDESDLVSSDTIPTLAVIPNLNSKHKSSYYYNKNYYYYGNKKGSKHE